MRRPLEEIAAALDAAALARAATSPDVAFPEWATCVSRLPRRPQTDDEPPRRHPTAADFARMRGPKRAAPVAAVAPAAPVAAAPAAPVVPKDPVPDPVAIYRREREARQPSGRAMHDWQWHGRGKRFGPVWDATGEGPQHG